LHLLGYFSRRVKVISVVDAYACRTIRCRECFAQARILSQNTIVT